MQAEHIEITLTCDYIDVPITILVTSNVNSTVLAVCNYLTVLVHLESMARMFFESDIVLRLSSIVMQMNSMHKDERHKKFSQVINILNLFAVMAKQRTIRCVS